MHKKCNPIPFLVLALCALPSDQPASAQAPESRVLATAVGGGLGVASGGYITLSIIVAESRMGRYIHDVEDILGWRSMPVITGAAIGGALGAYSPRRLEAAAVYGLVGLGTGALAGLGIGQLVWSPPEGRWAGAAIGAGVGLLIGNVYGMLNPYRSKEGEAAEDVDRAGIPVMVRIPL